MRKHESIMITTDRKNVLMAAFVAMILIVAVKWFLIGFWVGRGE